MKSIHAFEVLIFLLEIIGLVLSTPVITTSSKDNNQWKICLIWFNFTVYKILAVPITRTLINGINDTSLKWSGIYDYNSFEIATQVPISLFDKTFNAFRVISFYSIEINKTFFVARNRNICIF